MNNYSRLINKVKSMFPTGLDMANASAVTATSDGLTTGIIPSTAKMAVVTSANANYIAALPTPTANSILFVYVKANGCEFRTGTGVYMNGVIGAATNELAITANTISICLGVDATHWYILTATAGVPDGV